ncbi:MAG: class I SAM-dependent methyltransferase [Candidatus Paceibacterota bacterium]
MKTKDTKLYTSAESYFQGPDGMKNEVAMWFVAGGLLLQHLAKKSGHRPFGGLNSSDGEIENSRLSPVEVLDLCSGPGNFVNHLQFVFPKLKAFCVDANKIFIESGENIFPNWVWKHSNAVTIDLKRKFEVITMSSAYHHISDEYKCAFLKNAKKHLANDGIIIVCENFLPDYLNVKERAASVEKYYLELKKYYNQGNATPEALKSIEEVYQLEKFGVEEHKVSYRLFTLMLEKVGLLIDQDVIVWQPDSLRTENAGSHVLVLKKMPYKNTFL